MKHAQQLFRHYTVVWALLLQQSARCENPALYLLEHDARTPLFYLESMSRLLKNIHNPKKMRRLNQEFKTLEDALGQIDHYAVLSKTFKSHRKIPAQYKQHWRTQMQSACAHLNQVLHDTGWLGTPANRLTELEQIYQSIDWLGTKKLKKQLTLYYRQEIALLVTRLTQPIKEIESDVHELRRQLRWLSIYPKAFKGFIVLATPTESATSLSQYATPEIVQSPFNQLPVVDDIEHHLNLNREAYFALSWLIAQLGQYKDSGLQLLAIAECAQNLHQLNAEQAQQRAQKILGLDYPSIETTLKAAQESIRVFNQNEALQQLILAK